MKTNNTLYFIESVDHITKYVCADEYSALVLKEMILVKAVRNPNIPLSIKSEIFEEIKKLQVRQNDLLGQDLKSKFPKGKV
jgi:hypothetical protein